MENVAAHSEPNPDGRKKLALQAKGLFVYVSIASPASAIAQAARIAERCKLLNIRPKLLGDSLLSDPDLMEDILSMAKRHHSRAELNREIYINLDKVKFVIDADFYMAEQLMVFTNNRLRKIYKAYYGKRNGSLEAELTEKVERLGISKNIRFDYPGDLVDSSPYKR